MKSVQPCQAWARYPEHAVDMLNFLVAGQYEQSPKSLVIKHVIPFTLGKTWVHHDIVNQILLLLCHLLLMSSLLSLLGLLLSLSLLLLLLPLPLTVILLHGEHAWCVVHL